MYEHFNNCVKQNFVSFIAKDMLYDNVTFESMIGFFAAGDF